MVIGEPRGGGESGEGSGGDEGRGGHGVASYPELAGTVGEGGGAGGRTKGAGGYAGGKVVRVDDYGKGGGASSCWGSDFALEFLPCVLGCLKP